MELAKTVHKYPLGGIGDEVVVAFPGTAKPVHFSVQRGQFHLWAEITPAALPPTIRKYRVVGTGWELPSHAQYVGTVHLDGFVWHLYDTGPG